MLVEDTWIKTVEVLQRVREHMLALPDVRSVELCGEIDSLIGTSREVLPPDRVHRDLFLVSMAWPGPE